MLQLHKPKPGTEYLLGMFLGGVYQEVMGSAHNMLGATHVVQVKASPGSSPMLGEQLLDGFSPSPSAAFEFDIPHAF